MNSPTTHSEKKTSPDSAVCSRSSAETHLSIIVYDSEGSRENEASTIEELLSYRDPSRINWIKVTGLGDKNAISSLAESYSIHPLTAEDILDTEHRPKAEEFDDYLYFNLKCITRKKETIAEYEQISLILTSDTVITFQERQGDSFDTIRRRITSNTGRIRRMGADYLAYTLLDSVVDGYFLVLDMLEEKIEEFELRATDATDTQFISDIQTAKQEVMRIRRVIWPLRESLSLVQRFESSLIHDELSPFLKDLQDNIIQATETVDNYRELLAGIMEVNLSSISNGMNSIMKVLTIISTIFIPLSFIVGIYGMNFIYMPELNHTWGYPLVLGIMAVIAGAMLLYFKKKKWI
ncbi:MAG: magnesium/cobalt transporter CorA [Spirochaetaceae bacterium]|jgi:magnesium transporter|nr:magnesium/cobalt transporter CorA [Spirochaetaceae bacterium]